MKIFKTFIVFLFVLTPALLSHSSPVPPKEKDAWKMWLEEVDPIITRPERATAKLLKTVEERKRFQEMFWKARTPDPHNPRNEYKIEYYRRLDYARRKLGGTRSDRGRIYILMGEPFNIERYTGEERTVDCEMWEYRTDGRHGLFPFMNIVFYKPRNTGDFQLYHPGIHQPRDLLSPYYADNARSLQQAYTELKKDSTELAQASLSVLPDEGDPGMNMALSSSNFAFNKIYTLPEKEAEVGYIRNFKTPTGTVQVSHTTKSIRGHGCTAITRNKNVTFINYALMPDTLKFQHVSQNRYKAEINLHINIEDQSGKLIYQNLRKIDLDINTARKQTIDKRKVVFMNFAPIIEGDFDVTLMFINKSTQEFFTYKEKVSVKPDAPLAVAGFKIQTLDNGNFMPFAADSFFALIDPRSTFNQKEALEGIVQAARQPELYLENLGNKNHKVKIDAVIKAGDLYKFRLPLTDVKDDNYRLMVKIPGEAGKAAVETSLRKIHVLPFYIDIQRPLPIAKPQPAAAFNNYRFIQAQEYLNMGNTDRAVAYFNQVPRQYWNASSLPVIAKAYYAKKDYNTVIRLLEKDDVKKAYATLILLANSSIELKRFDRAIEYLEKLREYGDSVEINQLLAATYLSTGRSEKARQHYEKARQLMKN
jgi:GWxTD domain-containing protein